MNYKEYEFPLDALEIGHEYEIRMVDLDGEFINPHETFVGTLHEIIKGKYRTLFTFIDVKDKHGKRKSGFGPLTEYMVNGNSIRAFRTEAQKNDLRKGVAAVLGKNRTLPGDFFKYGILFEMLGVPPSKKGGRRATRKRTRKNHKVDSN